LDLFEALNEEALLILMRSAQVFKDKLLSILFGRVLACPQQQREVSA
jgi:hypothetical protein